MCTASAALALGSSRLYCLPQSSLTARRPVRNEHRRHTGAPSSVADKHRHASLAAVPTSRRAILSAVLASLTGPSLALESLQGANSTDSLPSPWRSDTPDYSKPGPFKPIRLPRLEHICSECFPRCIGDQCLLRLDVTYPKATKGVGFGGPYPLAIFTSGYLVGCDAYQSYAERLASWGYTAVLYDKIESVTDTLNDEVSARMVTDIIDWCQVSRLMQQIADTQRVYLVGHSRGGKISCLAAAEDPRVAALCLIDPVDVTVYAPLGPGFPSAVAALHHVTPARQLPLAVVGAGIAGDCVPKYSNYSKFFESVPSAAWEVVIQNAGHFQFLDYQSALQRAVCPQGAVSEPDVRSISQAVLVAWGEAMVRNRSLQTNPASYKPRDNPYKSGAIQLGSDVAEMPYAAGSSSGSSSSASFSGNSKSKAGSYRNKADGSRDKVVSSKNQVDGSTKKAGDYSDEGDGSSSTTSGSSHTPSGSSMRSISNSIGSSSSARDSSSAGFNDVIRVGNSSNVSHSSSSVNASDAGEGGAGAVALVRNDALVGGSRNGSDCLVIEVDRATLGMAKQELSEAQSVASRESGDSRSQMHWKHGTVIKGRTGSSEMHDVTGNGVGRVEHSAGIGTSVASRAWHGQGDMSGANEKGVGKSENDSDGVLEDEGVVVAEDARTTRRRLESLVTHLQYQTLLSISSRFKNL